MTNNTFCTLPDEDAGPTKAWLVSHRDDPKWKPLFEHAYGRRPLNELFDLEKDPHQMNNVADEPAYKTIAGQLAKTLLDELVRTNDPRLVDGGKFFETPPMAGPVQPPRRKKK